MSKVSGKQLKRAAKEREALFNTLKNDLRETKALTREIQKEVAQAGGLVDLMLSHINKMNDTWNTNRPVELKTADEIQPDQLVTLLQQWVEREGEGDYEVARQRYITESLRWKNINDDILREKGKATTLEDAIRGHKREVQLIDGSFVEAWFDPQNEESNFDLHAKIVRDAHVFFGMSLAILDKRIAAAIVFYNECIKRFPLERPSESLPTQH